MVNSVKDHIEFALHQILLCHLETIEQSVSGIQADNDIEHLHQFRVALRQTRALLKLCHHYLPQTSDFFIDEFKWLAGATGTQRDLDIQLLNAQDQLNEQSPEFKISLLPILDELVRQREVAHVRLIKIIMGTRFKKLVVNWRAFISEQIVFNLSNNKDEQTQTVIKKLIARECRRLFKKGKVIKTNASSVKLHRMRIRVKRLRYLLLNFESLFDKNKKRCKRLLAALENLQSILGNHQDAVKTVLRLKRMLRSRISSKTFSGATVLCIKRWIELLAQQQKEARDQFPDAFKMFKKARHGIE